MNLYFKNTNRKTVRKLNVNAIRRFRLYELLRYIQANNTFGKYWTSMSHVYYNSFLLDTGGCKNVMYIAYKVRANM